MLEFIEDINIHVPNDDSTTLGERMMIYGMIRALEPDSCVEIGTHKGLTTLTMAQAVYDNRRGTVITIDPREWGARGNFREFPELEELIHFFPVTSFEFPETKEFEELDGIDFLFVDGLHERDIVDEEIRLYLPKLNKNAVVLFHDCGGDNMQVGVNAAIKEAKLKNVFLDTGHKIRVYSHA